MTLKSPLTIGANPSDPDSYYSGALEGQRVEVAADDALTAEEWSQALIALDRFNGIDLANVDTIAIGIGQSAPPSTPGGAGTLYIDDIGLVAIAD